MTNPLIKKIDPQNPDANLIAEAASLLVNGAMVVAPTETRYGLLARADLPESIEQVYRLKNRPEDKPLAMFAPDLESFQGQAGAHPFAQRLASRYLPGPLTMVMKVTDDSHLPLTRKGRLGIRVSSSPVITGILKRAGFPLTATSANRSGAGESTTIESIVSEFGSAVSLYLDAGVLSATVSTVVDITDTPPSVIREGAIAASEISTVWEGGR